MNFDFDQQQYALHETVARLLADGTADWSALAEHGLFALLVPEEFGGVGLTFVDVALIVQELGNRLAPIAIAETLIATDFISRCASHELKAQLLPAIAAGKMRIALAWLEAEAGYDVSDFTTSIAGGKLSGGKMLVPFANDADMILVATDGGLALVDRSVSGISLTAHESIDPSCAYQALKFESVTAEMIGDEGAVARLFDVAATVYAGMLLGVSDRLLSLAAAYACERIQFDRPIGSFQAIKHKCADMAVSVEAAKSIVYYAFWAIAEDAPDRRRATSMAKAWCNDVASKTAAEAIQIHGGMGFTWELGLHHYLRRAKAMAAAYGDTAWHREHVVAMTLADMRKA
jgi:alkylation response protein AidB-like acyl-CoA dehydrogenase